MISGRSRALPTGAHVFVDESKSRDYILAATWLSPTNLATARSALRRLLLPGQRRIHFNHERDRRRRQILDVMAGLDARAVVVRAGGLHDREARRLCLDLVVTECLDLRARLLTLERDDAAHQADAALLRRRTIGTDLAYRHEAPTEPILWISDALAWCHQRGGAWIERSSGLVEREVRLR